MSLKVKIVAVGDLKERFFVDACAEYAKRASRFCRIESVEIPEVTVQNPSQSEIETILKKEEKNILPKLEGYKIALDVKGKELSSEEFAKKLDDVALQGNGTVTFVIGSSHGLSQGVLSACDARMSFGKITLPHRLARVVLFEQIYRAFSILNGLPYHK